MNTAFDSTQLFKSLSQGREESFKALAALPWPNFKDEDWKYTSLNALAQASCVPSSKPFVFENCQKFLTNAPLIKENVNPGGLFKALNRIFSPSCQMIDIPPGLEVNLPLKIVYALNASDNGKAFFPGLTIRLGKGARARILQIFSSRNAAGILIDDVNDIMLEPEAELELVQIFLNDAQSFQISHTHVHQKKDSRLRMFQYTDGANVFRNNLNVVLDAEGSETVLNGLHDLKDIRQADSHTFVDHVAPNARSNQLYKSILDGESRSVFNGKILVRREAQLTNSYQLNKNLLLSRDARVDTKPQLQIYADDVKCSHGATIGQLDDEQLFYLQTRGVGKDDARKMLIRGFVDDVINQVKDLGLKKSLLEAIS
ncbi:MAG: Fe-S cluster assembly protein SufD [Candidatus Omnitrophica bacterium]|nr:Fe-S cluster assembly protein SufD [Candidatus Omnitrophota bacterium]